jgi:hypothetical protein
MACSRKSPWPREEEKQKKEKLFQNSRKRITDPSS